MNRLSRLAEIISATMVAGLLVSSVRPMSARSADSDWSSNVATIGSIALQLGVQVSPQVEEGAFEPGVQFTGTLVKPEKLGALGIKGMHAGARVTVARITIDRVFVEADELDPPVRASTRLQFGSDGTLRVSPKT